MNNNEENKKRIHYNNFNVRRSSLNRFIVNKFNMNKLNMNKLNMNRFSISTSSTAKSKVCVNKQAQVIGIMGLARGIGTTHLSIMIGNYLANAVGMQIAIVECNNHHDYIKIELDAERKKDQTNHFSYGELDFYKNVDADILQHILQKNYDFIILDLDYEQNWSRSEFFRSTYRIVVADLELWNISSLIHFLKDQKGMPVDAYQYVSVAYESRIANKLERDFHISLKKIPLERNPFSIAGQSLLWFQNLLDHAQT